MPISKPKGDNDVSNQQQLPTHWNEIVNRGLLKYFCGPCPVCSAEATTAEQMIWPIIKVDDTGGAFYRVICRHDDHCHTKRVGWYTGSPVGAILDWNQRHWSGTRYDLRSEKKDVSDAEAMEHYAIKVVKGERHPEDGVRYSIESEVLWLLQNSRNAAAEALDNR